jgi:hypothetical protein
LANLEAALEQHEEYLVNLEATLEQQEGYLANLEVTLEQPKEQDIDSLPKWHYFVPGAAPKEEDGWDDEIEFNDGNDNPDSIDRFLVLP